MAICNDAFSASFLFSMACEPVEETGWRNGVIPGLLFRLSLGSLFQSVMPAYRGDL